MATWDHLLLIANKANGADKERRYFFFLCGLAYHVTLAPDWRKSHLRTNVWSHRGPTSCYPRDKAE